MHLPALMKMLQVEPYYTIRPTPTSCHSKADPYSFAIHLLQRVCGATRAVSIKLGLRSREGRKPASYLASETG